MTDDQHRYAGDGGGRDVAPSGSLEPVDDEFIEELFGEEEAEESQRSVSRRQFLTGALAGGAGGLALAAGTGATVWKLADVRMEQALAEANDELARMQGLVDLYERLEKVGLDAILQTGMVAVTAPLEGVELGATALKRGLELVEQALLAVEEAIPSAEEALLWIEDRVSGLASGIGRVEAALGRALERAGDTRVGEAIKDFGAWILDKLPFGLGDKIRDVIDGLAELLTGIDDLVAGVNESVLEPLRLKWFSTESDEGVRRSLLDPLIEHVLDPLEAHLGKLATLVDAWQAKLMAPSQRALEDRAQIREEIARYRQTNGLG